MTWYAMHDTQAHDKATTANNWRTPGTSVSGRYNTLNSKWNKVTKYGGSYHKNSYPKRKLLPEFNDEALEPIQPKSDTANRPDPPPCERDRAANKVTHKSTHDLRENLRQKSGATRSI